MEYSTNLLLRHLPEELWNSIQDQAHSIPILHKVPPCDPLTQVAFPLRGLLSVIVDFADGSTQEVGCVGREGMTGAHTIWSDFHAELCVIGQAKGQAIVLPLALVRTLSESCTAFHNAIAEYLSKRYVELCQIAACNGQHNVPQRLAKWILTTRDRVQASQVQLTHGYLALMLGTRRATVTIAAQRFAENGWIRYSRGAMEILDGHSLEQAACPCYALSPFSTAEHGTLTRSAAQ